MARHKCLSVFLVLGDFAKLRKAIFSFVMSVWQSVCLSVCLFAWNNSAFTRRILMKFNIWVFSKISRENSSFSKNQTRITGTLHEDIFIFMTISRWILLRIKNILNEICNENQNTFYSEQFFPPENRAVFEIKTRNVVEPERPQTIWRMRFGCWIN